jgi:hypothetical protein
MIGILSEPRGSMSGSREHRAHAAGCRAFAADSGGVLALCVCCGWLALVPPAGWWCCGRLPAGVRLGMVTAQPFSNG